MKRIVFLVAVVLATLIPVSSVMAAESYTLFGDAELVSPGNLSDTAVQLRSVTGADPFFGGIDFEIPAATTFADLATLSTDYMFEADDSCGGSGPRFQVNVEDSVTLDTGNIFVYIGPPPNYTLCPPSVWANTGDLLEGVNPIDTSQLDGGTFYDPYTTALTKYSGYTVTGVQLVTDASWFFGDGEQTVFIDNTIVGGVGYSYEALPVDEQIEELKALVQSSVAHPGARAQLISHLNRAQVFLNNGQTQAAINELNQFIMRAEMYSPRLFSDELADEFIAQAEAIKESISPSQPPPGRQPN